MRRIFILLYVGVLAVLFAAWYIHGLVLKSRSDAQTARVYIEAHGGGAMVIAGELDRATDSGRRETLEQLRERVGFPIEVLPTKDLPKPLARKIENGENVVAWLEEDRSPRLVTPLESREEILSIGPFPEYTTEEIEASMQGWATLTADKLESASAEERPLILAELRGKFGIPIEIVSQRDLPRWAQAKIDAGSSVVFFPITTGEGTTREWFTASPLRQPTQDDSQLEMIRFGPFPRFEDLEQKAATTTLALVLIPAALVITLLLRPVAMQLRRVEATAIEIASGDLSARVDVNKSGSAKHLAVAFNKMANQTENMVRSQRELLQAVSHELRTPLARIRFAIELIEAAQTDEERAGRLQSLVSASEEMDGLVAELLEYAKLDESQSDALAQVIDPSEPMEAVRFKYSEIYPKLEIQVPASPSDEQSLLVADPHGFQRTMNNLLSNACRFARSSVNVSISRRDDWVTIDVDDDGDGIDEQDRSRAFEPFVQLGEDADSRRSGVGLGLALVSRIMLQNRGKIEILDNPQGGCRVRTYWQAT